MVMTIPFIVLQTQMNHERMVISAMIFGCRENGEKIGIEFFKIEIYFNLIFFRRENCKIHTRQSHGFQGSPTMRA